MLKNPDREQAWQKKHDTLGMSESVQKIISTHNKLNLKDKIMLCYDLSTENVKKADIVNKWKKTYRSVMTLS